MTLTELIELARELPAAEQFELVSQVLAMADARGATADAPVDVDDAWKAEFRRRIDDVESGRGQLVDGRETMRIARERVAARRAAHTA